FNELGVSTERIDVPGTACTSIVPAIGVEPIAVSGWIHPHDPLLPALALAADRAHVNQAWGGGERLTGLRMIAYRPLRRAVLRAEFTTLGPLRIKRTIFLKVGRPKAIEALRRRHQLLAGSRVAVPAVLKSRPSINTVDDPAAGGPAAGILGLDAGIGVSLSAAIRAHGGAVLDPQDFIDQLDALPSSVMGLPPRRAWSDSIGRYQQAATLALPHRAGELAGLTGRIEEHFGASERGERVPAHGDYYDANILLHAGRISSLLDLDSLGPGYRVDDLACLLAHLAILPTLGAKNAAASLVLERFGRAFQSTVDPRALWARSAAVALTLIAGARGLDENRWPAMAEARLQVVKDLLGRADALD
ncbi:MAG: phosphotransferase, partial [Micrococcaceae bacterium]|nr:phosphotransferase [Micrococcaceae bacterium]